MYSQNRILSLALMCLLPNVVTICPSVGVVGSTVQNSDETRIALQPLAQQARQIQGALSFLGQPLLTTDVQRINTAIGQADEAAAVEELERVMDQYALVVVTINAESRVKVDAGPAKPELEQEGTRLFLVKVVNGAGVTARLRVQSENSGTVYVPSDFSAEPSPKARTRTCRSAGRIFRCTTRIPWPN